MAKLRGTCSPNRFWALVSRGSPLVPRSSRKVGEPPQSTPQSTSTHPQRNEGCRATGEAWTTPLPAADGVEGSPGWRESDQWWRVARAGRKINLSFGAEVVSGLNTSRAAISDSDVWRHVAFYFVNTEPACGHTLALAVTSHIRPWPVTWPISTPHSVSGNRQGCDLQDGVAWRAKKNQPCCDKTLAILHFYTGHILN